MFTPEYFQQVSKQPGFTGFNNLGAAQFQSPTGFLPGDERRTPASTSTPPRPLTPAPTGPGSSGGGPRGGYDPVKAMEEGWKQEQARMQQVQMQNQQREQMIQQRRQEERYKQMMGMDLNASLRPWNLQVGQNPMLAAQAGANLGIGSTGMGSAFGGSMHPFGGQAGFINPLGGLPSWSPPPVSPIQMLGVPGRFGQMQTSGQPSHMQAGQFFGTGVREVSQPYYSSLQYE